MTIADTTRARAKAAVSAAEANVIEIQTELKQANSMMDGSSAASELLASIAGLAVVGDLTETLRDDRTVDQAKLQAKIDRITADLRAAEDKLATAKKTQAALLAILGPDPAESATGTSYPSQFTGHPGAATEQVVLAPGCTYRAAPAEPMGL